MSKYQTPCRYDFVGSFLRPQEVKQAKADYAEGKISEEEKDRIIDAAIADVVKKQKELGYHVITDGEFRRTYWHLDFMWGFEGVGHEQTGGGVQFHEELASIEDTYLTGKVKAKPHPFVEYFKFLKQFEDENTVAKYTIPAPAQMFQQMIVPANYANTRKYYPTNEEQVLSTNHCQLTLTLAIRNVFSCTSFSYVLLRLTSTDSGSYSAPVLHSSDNIFSYWHN